MSERRGRTWGDLRPFLPRWSPLRIVFVGATSFLGGLSESVVLVLLTLTADSLIRSETEITIAGIELGQQEAVGVALLLVLLRVVTTLANSLVSARFASQVMEHAQTKVLTAYLATSHEVRSTRLPGDLSSVVVTHGRFTGDLASSFCAAAAAICGLVAFGGTSLAVNPLATLGITAIGTVALAAMRPIRSRSRASARSFTDAGRGIAAETAEAEALHREIEVFQVAPAVLARIQTDLRSTASRFVRVRFYSSAVPQLFQAVLLGAAVASLLLIVNNVDDTDLAAVGAVVLLLIRSMSSAQQLVNTTQRMVEQRPYAEGINELISTFETGTPPAGVRDPEHLTPVKLHDVSFSYDGSATVLDRLTVEIDKGELVGIVGPSGAGKSTLVELLLRLRQPTSGIITCGGVPLVEIDPAKYAPRVAFVPQQAVLIRGTVAENVDLFRGLPEERLRAALKEAHLEAEIDALPDGIHTRLGPDDRALSGGQRQRLTIARALAGDPEILILDEPTSALDAVSEHAIRETLSELPAKRLVIVVAHRYSTLRSCSRILALRDGRIEADAHPDQVSQQSDFFRRMASEGA